MTVQVPTSPNGCFGTTWGKQNFFYRRQYDDLIKITLVKMFFRQLKKVTLSFQPRATCIYQLWETIFTNDLTANHCLFVY